MDSFGEIGRKTFAIYGRHFGLFLAISVAGRMLYLLLDLAHVFVIGVHLERARYGNLMLVPNSRGVDWLFIWAILIFSSVIYGWMQGSTLFAITAIQQGRRPTPDSVLLRAWNGIAGPTKTSLLGLVATIAAFFLLMIPGIYVGSRLLVSVPVAVMERCGARAAVRRSWRLTKGNAGRAFLGVAVILAVTIAMVYFVQRPFQREAIRELQRGGDVRAFRTVGELVRSGLHLMIDPIWWIWISLFYLDLRGREEAPSPLALGEVEGGGSAV